MVEYTTTILKFGDQGEKTGWTYIDVPADVAQQLKPNYKKSFRVKGKLDGYAIEKVALLPMGQGAFIMPLNVAMRKGTGKRHGAMLQVMLEVDESVMQVNAELLECLADEAEAMAFFEKLPPSHQLYYSKWIESSKTEATKTKRIAQTVTAMVNGQSYSQMMRSLQANKQQR